MKKLLLFISIAVVLFAWGCDGNGCGPNPPADGITVIGPISSDVGIGHPWMTAWEDLSTRDYVEEEFFYEGYASSYQVDGDMTADGLWDVSEADKAVYKTRLLVRRPKDASKFNGTVVMEWFNVSGGVDAGPAWMFLEPFLTREGYIWVGVSAQQVGVQGGGFSMLGNAVKPLTKWDPERYGSLVHPGDPYSYDMFTQAAKAVKGEGSKDVLGGLITKRLLAYGESQSDGTMTTYTNAVQPLAKVFDGIFIHSRGAIRSPKPKAVGVDCRP